MNIATASIIGGGLIIASLILVFSRKRLKGGPDEALAQSQQLQVVQQQMLQQLQANQAELARQRDSLQQALNAQRESIATEQSRLREELGKQLGSSQQAMQQRLAEANQTINVRLGQAAKMFNEINRGLGTVSEFSKQLTNLRDVFQSPKLRGNIGEEVLKQLLEQVLPQTNYQMQFKFRAGQMVDAIVRTKQGLIPIDSKFPLENFRAINEAQRSADSDDEDAARRVFVRDVKKHIDAIRTKYILPEEGTVDFAVMYVPSEAIYYEIVQNAPELIDYAGDAKVYLVSPNTFYYFLKVILIGLEGARMEEMSRKVLSLLRTVQKDTGAFGESLAVLNRHLTNAKNAGDKVSGKFERLTTSLDTVKLLEATEQPAEVLSNVAAESPHTEKLSQQLTIDVAGPSTDD